MSSCSAKKKDLLQLQKDPGRVSSNHGERGRVFSERGRRWEGGKKGKGDKMRLFQEGGREETPSFIHRREKKNRCG